MSTDAYSVTDSIGVTAESHTLSGRIEEFEVVNVDGAGYVCYRFDGVTAVLDAEGCDVLPRAAGSFVRHDRGARKVTGDTTLSLIASVATVVHIRKIA